MYYEINVALDGKHFFATAERSVTNPLQLKKILLVFFKAFPKEEGYSISVTKWEKCGEHVDVERFHNVNDSSDEEFLL